MTDCDEAVTPWTERLLLDRLRRRHEQQSGNGPEWAYMEHVRDNSGFFAGRTIDALAMHLWPSRNHEVHAFEVKVSRTDFLRELSDEQAKSAPWRAWVEYFWIVAPVAAVSSTDLPQGWGLLTPRATGLAVVRRPTRLRTRRGALPEADIPRPLVACMLRQAGRAA